ncbi:SNAPN protein, partial [Corythaixoides concolor]|nr:SNAPN protein [Corythaixoides concolor]
GGVRRASGLGRSEGRRFLVGEGAGVGLGLRRVFPRALIPPLHRESQVELREHIDSLATGETWEFAPHPLGVCGPLDALPPSALSLELCRINEDQKVALDLDPYVKKLLNARRRVVLVNNILQNAQERLRRLNHSVAKETVRRKAMLEAAGGYPQGLPGK